MGFISSVVARKRRYEMEATTAMSDQSQEDVRRMRHGRRYDHKNMNDGHERCRGTG